MPRSQSLAIVPQDAVACGRLYFIGVSSWLPARPTCYAGVARFGKTCGRSFGCAAIIFGA